MAGAQVHADRGHGQHSVAHGEHVPTRLRAGEALIIVIDTINVTFDHHCVFVGVGVADHDDHHYDVV